MHVQSIIGGPSRLLVLLLIICSGQVEAQTVLVSFPKGSIDSTAVHNPYIIFEEEVSLGSGNITFDLKRGSNTWRTTFSARPCNTLVDNSTSGCVELHSGGKLLTVHPQGLNDISWSVSGDEYKMTLGPGVVGNQSVPLQSFTPTADATGPSLAAAYFSDVTGNARLTFDEAILLRENSVHVRQHWHSDMPPTRTNSSRALVASLDPFALVIEFDTNVYAGEGLIEVFSWSDRQDLMDRMNVSQATFDGNLMLLALGDGEMLAEEIPPEIWVHVPASAVLNSNGTTLVEELVVQAEPTALDQISVIRSSLDDYACLPASIAQWPSTISLYFDAPIMTVLPEVRMSIVEGCESAGCHTSTLNSSNASLNTSMLAIHRAQSSVFGAKIRLTFQHDFVPGQSYSLVIEELDTVIAPSMGPTTTSTSSSTASSKSSSTTLSSRTTLSTTSSSASTATTASTSSVSTDSSTSTSASSTSPTTESTSSGPSTTSSSTSSTSTTSTSSESLTSISSTSSSARSSTSSRTTVGSSSSTSSTTSFTSFTSLTDSLLSQSPSSGPASGPSSGPSMGPEGDVERRVHWLTQYEMLPYIELTVSSRRLGAGQPSLPSEHRLNVTICDTSVVGARGTELLVRNAIVPDPMRQYEIVVPEGAVTDMAGNQPTVVQRHQAVTTPTTTTIGGQVTFPTSHASKRSTIALAFEEAVQVNLGTPGSVLYIGGLSLGMSEVIVQGKEVYLVPKVDLSIGLNEIYAERSIFSVKTGAEIRLQAGLDVLIVDDSSLVETRTSTYSTAASSRTHSTTTSSHQTSSSSSRSTRSTSSTTSEAPIDRNETDRGFLGGVSSEPSDGTDYGALIGAIVGSLIGVIFVGLVGHYGCYVRHKKSAY